MHGNASEGRRGSLLPDARRDLNRQMTDIPNRPFHVSIHRKCGYVKQQVEELLPRAWLTRHPLCAFGVVGAPDKPLIMDDRPSDQGMIRAGDDLVLAGFVRINKVRAEAGKHYGQWGC